MPDDRARLLKEPFRLPRETRAAAPGRRLFKPREEARRGARAEVLKQLRAARMREPRREPRARRSNAARLRTPPAQCGALAAATQRDEAAPPRLKQRRVEPYLAPQGTPDFACDAQKRSVYKRVRGGSSATSRTLRVVDASGHGWQTYQSARARLKKTT
jgi:hypothetical protein